MHIRVLTCTSSHRHTHTHTLPQGTSYAHTHRKKEIDAQKVPIILAYMSGLAACHIARNGVPKESYDFTAQYR